MESAVFMVLAMINISVHRTVVNVAKVNVSDDGVITLRAGIWLDAQKADRIRPALVSFSDMDQCLTLQIGL